MIFRWIPTEVAWALASIVAALAVASAAVAVLRKRKPDSDFTELIARVRTWWVIVLLFGGAMLLGRYPMLAFFAVVSFLALREYLRLMPTRAADQSVLVWAYASIPIQYALVGIGFYEMFIIFVPVYVFMALPIRAMIVGQTAGFVDAMARLHWGLMVTVFSMGHTAYLLAFAPYASPRVAPAWPSEFSSTEPGPGLLLLVVLLTQTNDVFQYLWGKSIGRRRVVPTVSPNKTWGGLVGGVASTILLAGLIGPVLTLLDLPRALLAGMLIGIGGFFGDLSMSALKRDRGVKDSGDTLPGHGGVLDRVDSLSYTAPIFFHYVYFLY